jgi:anaerobic ribonucleoside-triphosphate reductase activating protein
MKDNNNKIRLAVFGVAPRTISNGPGERFAIWIQGCHYHCPGCSNPEMLKVLDADAGDFVYPSTPGWIATSDLIGIIKEEMEKKPLDGVTITGGEAFDQSDALFHFLSLLRELDLGIIVFTGHTKEELMGKPEGKRFFRPMHLMDILVDGAYERMSPMDGSLRVSLNQRMILLTTRYQEDDLHPESPLECFVDSDGSVIYTGFTPPPTAIG